MTDLSDIKSDLKRFFEMLDYTEESDEGHIFHPINISCCRVMMMPEMEAILKRMKDYSKEETS